jgi:hypothetical protein
MFRVRDELPHLLLALATEVAPDTIDLSSSRHRTQYRRSAAVRHTDRRISRALRFLAESDTRALNEMFGSRSSGGQSVRFGHEVEREQVRALPKPGAPVA